MLLHKNENRELEKGVSAYLLLEESLYIFFPANKKEKEKKTSLGNTKTEINLVAVKYASDSNVRTKREHGERMKVMRVMIKKGRTRGFPEE